MDVQLDNHDHAGAHLGTTTNVNNTQLKIRPRDTTLGIKGAHEQ